MVKRLNPSLEFHQFSVVLKVATLVGILTWVFGNSDVQTRSSAETIVIGLYAGILYLVGLVILKVLTRSDVTKAVTVLTRTVRGRV
jgi:hypothetical protein